MLLTCRWGALPALAAFFTASVERKALQHLHTHGRDVYRESRENKDIIIKKSTKNMVLLNAQGSLGD